MVKAALGARLLRSLTRAGKAQQRQVTKLASLWFAAPKPKAKTKVAAKPKVKPVTALKAPKPASVFSPPKPQPAPKPLVAKALLKPAPKPPAARPAPRTATTPAAPAGLTIRSNGRQHVEALPGRWLAAHYSASPNAGHPAGGMAYWLYLPDNVPETAVRNGLPLIVMLHGCHQTATQFAQGTRMNRLAEQKGYAVLYPQQLVSTQAQRCWKWYDRSTQEGGGDVRIITGIIGKVCEQYRIDRRRIYIAGISAGAAMANIVALNHPELIAAVGLHSSPMFGAGHSTIGALGVMQHGSAVRTESAIREVLARRPGFPSMPTILIQGEGDKVVRPINQSQLVRQSLLLNGLSPATQARVALKPAGRGGSRHAHEIRDYHEGSKLLLRVAQISELDHAWSGGDPEVSFHSKAGPDASKMMLEFFAKHRRAVRKK
ncbi:MAG: PHB depolymerase family esterase [Pseudomonadota bacterium]